MPLVPLYTPSKHQKTSGFLLFSGGIERDQWHEMGLKKRLASSLLKSLGRKSYVECTFKIRNPIYDFPEDPPDNI